MKELVVVRLQPSIQDSKYAEYLSELENRNIEKPVVCSKSFSDYSKIATITFKDESFDDSAAILSNMGIQHEVVSARTL